MGILDVVSRDSGIFSHVGNSIGSLHGSESARLKENRSDASAEAFGVEFFLIEAVNGGVSPEDDAILVDANISGDRDHPILLVEHRAISKCLRSIFPIHYDIP